LGLAEIVGGILGDFFVKYWRVKHIECIIRRFRWSQITGLIFFYKQVAPMEPRIYRKLKEIK